MRLFAIVAVLTAFAPFAAAQRGSGSAHFATSGLHSPGYSVRGRAARRSGFRRSSPYAGAYTSLPFPFFDDSFDPDDIYSTGYPVASLPPPFLMQAIRAMAGSASDSMRSAVGHLSNREPSSSDPLLIELQGGRYVRVNYAPIDGEALPLNLPENSTLTKSTRDAAAKIAAPGAEPLIAASPAAHNLPSVVLVFRDGHSEEVRDYTIADGVLYARGDLYTDGYWNKKINLARLDVPETLSANSSRNVKFELPSSPNEVITRF